MKPNPAGARRQALGVSDPRMLDKMVETLARLGSDHVVAFHGHDGLDELSTSGPSRVVELDGGETRTWELDPTDLGFEPHPVQDVAGGSPEENASLVRDLLAGEQGPRRDIVVLNAAAGLLAARLAADIEAGVAQAAAAIDSGGAAAALDRLVEVSNAT